MMTPILMLALGSFICAGAHYVREGAEFSYAAWCLLGVGLVALESIRERFLLPQVNDRQEK